MTEEYEGHRRRRRRERREARAEGAPSPQVEAPPREDAPRAAPIHALRVRIAALLPIFGIAIVAFTVGLLIFNHMVMPGLVHQTGEVRVPDLVNLTFEQAEQAVGAVGLQLSRSGERFDTDVPRGLVASQDPSAYTPVRGRRRVMVIMSLGEEFSSVPALFGESQRSARFLLERAGLRLGAIAHTPSELVGDGLIVDSDPPAESLLPRDAPVHLLLSMGSGEEAFVMPDLLGREINAARRQLESFGFTVLTPPSAPHQGSIVSQEPAAGSRMTRTTTILLQTSGRMIR